MSRRLPEWVGKSDEERIPDRVQVRVFERTAGKCAACGRRLYPGAWECDHIIPLIAWGKHAESNLQALCKSPCHTQKTAADVAEKSRVYRKKVRHLGIKRRRTIPGRRFDGTPRPARWIEG